MDAYLAAFANYRGVGPMRPMSRQNEDEYYRTSEWAWSKVAWIAAAALPFSALNPASTENEARSPAYSFGDMEAAQWH